MRPHRQQPTRLPCPRDSPGNTGVGCHFFLQCIKVKSESEIALSCPTLRDHDPMDSSPPGCSVHGIFQARVLEWGAITFSKDILSIYYFSVFLYTFTYTYPSSFPSEALSSLVLGIPQSRNLFASFSPENQLTLGRGAFT